MDFDITQGIGILERTPGTLHAMLHDLGTAWIDATEGPEAWGAYVFVGHLVHRERANWIPRARFILSQSTSRRLPPYDQTVRVMAKQDRDAIGPWRAYLPIVDR